MMGATGLAQLPTLDSDSDDVDIQLLSSDDEDKIEEGFIFNAGGSSFHTSNRSQMRIPDQGVTTMKRSISSRKMKHDDMKVEGDEEHLVEIQSKRPKMKTPPTVVAASASADANLDFISLGLSRVLLANLYQMGIHRPTPVQQKAIPCVLHGQDILVNAVTGSGKTCAFMLPILERLIQCQNRLSLSRVLVLLPTRELANQCFQVTQQLCQSTFIRVCVVVGGYSMQKQVAALQTRPEIVIATPGRLIDHVRNSQSIHLDTIEILVLDEADRLLELGFVDEVQECINACPKSRQTMLFSATLTPQVASLADLSLTDPRRISISSAHALPKNLSQEFVRIRDNSVDTSMAILLALCRRTVKERAIVFFPSRILAHRAFHVFGLAGLKAAELHGDLTQLQRMDALEQFRSANVEFLLSTDLASRGLDIADVRTVLNFSFPTQLSTYVHRVGRTARAGKCGHAITLVTDQARPLLKEILKNSSCSVKSRKISPDVIKAHVQMIDSMEGRMIEILNEEKFEKEIRVAEMKANKMQNMLVHEKEIVIRPKKTWFCTAAEKKKASSASTTVGLKADTVKKQIIVQSQKPLNEKLRGQSRKQKRRKLQEIEDFKNAQEGEGPSPSTVISIASRLEKSRRRITKQQLDQGGLLKKRKTLFKRTYPDDGGDANPFIKRYKNDREDEFDKPADKKDKKKQPKKGSFNSKNRFKRRK